MWAFGINYLDLIPLKMIDFFLDKMLIKDTVIVADNGQLSINFDDAINKLKSMVTKQDTHNVVACGISWSYCHRCF